MSRNNASQTGENKAATIPKNEPLVLAELSLHAVAVLFDPLPEAVVLADRGRRILYINAAAEALFGYSLAPLRNKKTETLYADPSDFVDQGKERYNPGADATFSAYRVSYQRSDGSMFLGQTSGGGLRDAEGVTQGYLGLIRPARSAEQSIDTLQRLHSITADSSLDHDARIGGILALGARHFGLDLAILSSVRGHLYRVGHCLDPAGGLVPGTTFDVSGTYCVHSCKRRDRWAFTMPGKVRFAPTPAIGTSGWKRTSAVRFKWMASCTERLITAMVAVAVNRPPDKPDSTRPSNNSHRLPPYRNNSALKADSTSPASSMGRRPTWSVEERGQSGC